MVNMSTPHMGNELPIPNLAEAKGSEAVVLPSAMAWVDIKRPELRTIFVNPKSVRQAQGDTLLFMRIFSCYVSAQWITQNSMGAQTPLRFP